MNQGNFAASINASWNVLELLGITKTRNQIPQFPPNPAFLFKDKSYLDVYKICLSSYYYHFELSDGSLLQFRHEGIAPLKLSYVYYESPYNILTFEDYIADAGWATVDDELVRKELVSMYEEDISSIANNSLKKHALEIRYDYGEATYTEGVHPVSHLHIGFKSNIRIGLKKILTPLSFVLFVVRQCYPDYWLNIHNLHEASRLSRNVRDNLRDIDFAKFWKTKDNRELILT